MSHIYMYIHMYVTLLYIRIDMCMSHIYMYTIHMSMSHIYTYRHMYVTYIYVYRVGVGETRMHV